MLKNNPAARQKSKSGAKSIALFHRLRRERHCNSPAVSSVESLCHLLAPSPAATPALGSVRERTGGKNGHL